MTPRAWRPRKRSVRGALVHASSEMSELALGLWAIWMGLWVWNPWFSVPETTALYGSMLERAPAPLWALAMVLLGTTHWIAWKLDWLPLRQVAALVAVIVWATVVEAFVTADWRSATTATCVPTVLLAAWVFIRLNRIRWKEREGRHAVAQPTGG